jgi:V/A-type H+-transporting ATPase subunit I
LAFFFFIYFGICLGDAGYGIVLMLLAVYFMKRYRLPSGGMALMKVFLFGGLASVIAGALFGSWFGIDFETVAVPLVVKSTLLKFKVLDIFKSPIVMLYFSFFLGLVQIFTGLFIGLYNTLKSRDYRAAFLDHISWICFLSGIVTWGLLKVAGHWSASIFGWFTLSWTVFLIFTQGRHKPTWYEKIWSGILSLYKTTGYLGDVLSYSRLLALGMCSAVIAMVINILAGLVKSIPIVGWVLMVVILIGGHLFNLLMSLMSAFIHSMRLQLVEFFGKFFGGGGRFFKSFQRESKYVNIFKEG